MFILASDKDMAQEKDITVVNVSPKTKKTFLFIGEMVQLEANNSFEIIYKATYSEAQAFLQELLTEGLCPELILLNLPFNSEQLINFNLWLENNCTHKIPLFYNESILDKALYMMLIKNELVDDIVQLDNRISTLEDKAQFIKKYSSDTLKNKESVSNKLQGYKVGRLKRLFDIVVSLVALIILSPVFLIIAIIIKYESDGPVFYKSQRAGHGFKVFDFYKFRTMEVDADKRINELSLLNQYSNAKNTPTFFKLRNDPRITKIGVILRNTSLDELPQFFNVLKGDMSIVGNRPLPLYEARTLTTNQMAERFMAPAGITGLWQVSKRGKDEMSAEERIQIDIDYARKHSLKNDLLIMLKTPSALIQKSNV